MNDEQVEGLSAGIKEQASIGDVIVSGCCRLPDWEAEFNEAFYRQLNVASQPGALVLKKSDTARYTVQEAPALCGR